ncbi:helix-turn-helix domain-containing protein [Terricaulis sp.]|uniref:helix-turn-helix domain-containing protein n=1 Tax=Terricaulis sp. TaxID=2768686 RepID=UPI003783470F
MLQPERNEQDETETVGAVVRPKVDARPLDLDPAWRAGRKLTEARRQLGLSIEEVADRIRVRREFLQALEDMNVKLLPGKAYALAFLRSYAKALGMDEKAIVDQFQDECALSREDATPQIRNPSSKPHPERPWLFAAALVILAVGLVGWRALSTRETVRPAQTAAVSAPAGVAMPAATAPVENRVVEIRALTEAWLEARGPDGTVFLSRTLQPGDVYRPDASPGWTLHARDGGAFQLFVNGADAGLLGVPGSPVLGRSIDEIQPLTQAQLATPRS